MKNNDGYGKVENGKQNVAFASKVVCEICESSWFTKWRLNENKAHSVCEVNIDRDVRENEDLCQILVESLNWPSFL